MSRCRCPTCGCGALVVERPPGAGQAQAHQGRPRGTPGAPQGAQQAYLLRAWGRIGQGAHPRSQRKRIPEKKKLRIFCRGSVFLLFCLESMRKRMFFANPSFLLICLVSMIFLAWVWGGPGGLGPQATNPPELARKEFQKKKKDW